MTRLRAILAGLVAVTALALLGVALMALFAQTGREPWAYPVSTRSPTVTRGVLLANTPTPAPYPPPATPAPPQPTNTLYPTPTPRPREVSKPTLTPTRTPTPYPTPAWPPTPTGSRPPDLQSIYYVAETGGDPELRRVLVDANGARWGEVSLAADLKLRPQFPGPILRNLYPSPDGHYLAADCAYGESNSTWVIDLASGTAKPLLTDERGLGQFLTWKPDSKAILFRTSPTLAPRFSGIWQVNIHDQSYKELDFPRDTFGNPMVYAILFSPDGKNIAYLLQDMQIPECQLWIMNADGSDKKPLIQGHPHLVLSRTSWAPAGDTLAVANWDDGTHKAPTVGRIWIVGLDGTVRQRFDTADMGQGFHLAWSPNGNLAFVAREEGRLTGSITIADLQTSRSQSVADRQGRKIANLAWSPDGKRIAFSLSDAGHGEVWLVDLATGTSYPVAGNARGDTPLVWLP